MRANILVYSFVISIALHLLLFVPWTSPQKLEKKQETIPVTYRTVAKKETQPPAPEKAKDKPKRARGLPQPTPGAAKAPVPTPPSPKPPPKPRAAEQPVPVAQKSTPPPPPPPKPQPARKIEPAKPTQEETPAPVTKKLAPLKDAKEPPKQQVVEKKATEPQAKPAEVKKEAPKKKTQTAKKPEKKRVAKKSPRAKKTSKKRKKTVAKKATPKKKETTTANKHLPTLKELLPPLMGSGRVATGSHGNEYISMDSRDPKYSSWLASLQRDIYRTWLPTYPRGNIRGEVLLGLMIEKDGDLAHVEVLRTSGLELLDRHAMEAVRAAAPFARFPPWMTQDRQGIKATFTYGGTPGTVRSWER